MDRANREQKSAEARRSAVDRAPAAIDSLKSAAAKRRHLEIAIAELRGRGISEEACRSLDDRLRSLE
jgi:hypothetical protein